MKKIVSLLLCILLLVPGALTALAADAPYETPYEDSEFFVYGDYTIHYRVIPAEEEKGRVMMLHGFAESTYCWRELAPILAENGYTCVLADIPDFGYSSRETAETARLPREEIVHALMTELFDGPWYLAGHSMGGYVALAVAQTYPESVKDLLLYGTSSNDSSPERMEWIASNEFLVRTVGSMMELCGKCVPLVRLLLRFAIRDNAYVNVYDVEKIVDPFRIEGTGAGAIYNFSMLTKTDLEAVSKMPPILLMNGDRDLVIKDSVKESLRASLPQGSVDHIVKGGGHMFIENMAEETANVTLAFLESCHS